MTGRKQPPFDAVKRNLRPIDETLSVEQRLLVGVIRTERAWRKIADGVAAEFGLTEATARPLLYLSRMDDGPRQADLAVAMDVERPSIAWLLDSLASSGHIERRDDAADKRAKRIYLTRKGAAATKAVQGTLERKRASLFGVVSQDRLLSAIDVLEDLYGTMNAP